MSPDTLADNSHDHLALEKAHSGVPHQRLAPPVTQGAIPLFLPLLFLFTSVARKSN